MNRRILLLCIMLSLLGIRTASAEGVDMSKYITLTVKQGAKIKLNVSAQNPNTVYRVTGVKDEKELIAPSFLNFNQLEYEALGTEIKVYGAISAFSCHSNYENLTGLSIENNTGLTRLLCFNNFLSSLKTEKNIALTELKCHNNLLGSLDIKKNTKLEILVIYGNNFSTSTLNELYCDLPDRKDESMEGELYPVNETGDATDELLVQSTNKAVPDARKWLVKYFDNENIIECTGTYSCSSPYNLTLAPKAMEGMFSCEGGEWKVKVTSDGSWKLNEGTLLPAWLTVEPKNGTTGQEVTIKALPNTSAEMHRATLHFVLNNDDKIKQIVLLKQAPASFSVTPTEDYTFPAEGETKTDYFTVESSGDWEVTSSNSNWFPVEPKSGGAGTNKVTIKAEKNTGAERSTELTFSLKNTELKQVVTLKQEGKFAISVTPAEGYTFPAKGETKENYFKVESTGAWTVTSSNTDWFPVETKSGNAGTTNVSIKAEANKTKAELSTNLTFALTDRPNIQQIVTLKQSAGALSVTPTQGPVFPAGGGKKINFFTVNSTSDWEVTSSNTDWFPIEETKRQGSDGMTKITIETKANTSDKERKTDLTFAIKGSEIKQIVTVKQEPASITVGPSNEYTFPSTAETKANHFVVRSTSEWVATSSNAAWFPIDPKNGEAGSTRLTITTDANNSSEERSTVITFALKNNAEIKQTITLKQQGKQADAITVSPTEEYTIAADGETKTDYFTVVSSGAWKVTSSNSAWFPIEESKRQGGEGTTKVTIKADENTGAERSTDLTFALDGKPDIKQVVTLKQTGKGGTPNPPTPDPAAVEDALFAGIVVSPNPFASQLIINNNEALNVRYTLVNASGQDVREGTLEVGKTSINTATIPAGVYFLRLTANGITKAYRLVKE